MSHPMDRVFHHCSHNPKYAHAHGDPFVYGRGLFPGTRGGIPVSGETANLWTLEQETCGDTCSPGVLLVRQFVGERLTRPAECEPCSGWPP